MELPKFPRYLFLICLNLNFLNGQNDLLILNGPSEGDGMPGFWGPWEMCPTSTYVIGFKLKSSNSRIVSSNEVETEDSFGLSGIELICGMAGNRKKRKKITSNVAAEGEWSSAKFCEGYAAGFEIKMGKEKGGDFVGPTNMRMACSGRMDKMIEHHLDFQPGNWEDSDNCPRYHAICGLRTKTKMPFDDDDLVGVSDLKLKCCPLNPDPVTCFPTDGLELLFDFDNIFGLQPVTYSYSLTVGITDTRSSSDGKSKLGTAVKYLAGQYQQGNGSREIQGRRRKRSYRNSPREQIQLQFRPRQTQLPSKDPIKSSDKTGGADPFPVPAPDPIPHDPIPVPGAPPTGLPPGFPSAEPPANLPGIFDPQLTEEAMILRIYTLGGTGTLTSGYDWGTSGADTWSPARTTQVSVVIPPEHSISLYQVVGVCGDFIIRAEKVYQNGTFLTKRSRSFIEDGKWGILNYVSNIVDNLPSILNDFTNAFKKFTKIVNFF